MQETIHSELERAEQGECVADMLTGSAVLSGKELLHCTSEKKARLGRGPFVSLVEARAAAMTLLGVLYPGCSKYASKELAACRMPEDHAMVARFGYRVTAETLACVVKPSSHR